MLRWDDGAALGDDKSEILADFRFRDALEAGVGVVGVRDGVVATEVSLGVLCRDEGSSGSLLTGRRTVAVLGSLVMTRGSG